MTLTPIAERLTVDERFRSVSTGSRTPIARNAKALPIDPTRRRSNRSFCVNLMTFARIRLEHTLLPYMTIALHNDDISYIKNTIQ